MTDYKQLIDDAIGGDNDAFATLYQLSYKRVYFSVNKIVFDDATTLDIMQDTYIKAHKNLTKLDDPNAWNKWVSIIAMNEAKNYLRKNRDLNLSALDSQEGLEFEIENTNQSFQPEMVSDKNALSEIVDSILRQLPEDQRICIMLFYFEQLKTKDIAALLDISENTVKSRLRYGKKLIEEQVLQLEKTDDIKLYGMAPLPFLLLLLREDLIQSISTAIPTPVMPKPKSLFKSATLIQKAVATLAVTSLVVTGAIVAQKQGFFDNDKTNTSTTENTETSDVISEFKLEPHNFEKMAGKYLYNSAVVMFNDHYIDEESVYSLVYSEDNVGGNSGTRKYDFIRTSLTYRYSDNKNEPNSKLGTYDLPGYYNYMLRTKNGFYISSQTNDLFSLYKISDDFQKLELILEYETAIVGPSYIVDDHLILNTYLSAKRENYRAPSRITDVIDLQTGQKIQASELELKEGGDMYVGSTGMYLDTDKSLKNAIDHIGNTINTKDTMSLYSINHIYDNLSIEITYREKSDPIQFELYSYIVNSSGDITTTLEPIMTSLNDRSKPLLNRTFGKYRFSTSSVGILTVRNQTDGEIVVEQITNTLASITSEQTTLIGYDKDTVFINTTSFDPTVSKPGYGLVPFYTLVAESVSDKNEPVQSQALYVGNHSGTSGGVREIKSPTIDLKTGIIIQNPSSQ